MAAAESALLASHDNDFDRLAWLTRLHARLTPTPPYNNPNAAVDHVHGYNANGGAIVDPANNDPHFPTTGASMNTADVFKTACGRVSAWVEQADTVHLKAVDEHGDPVELTADELRSLIEELSRLYGIIKTEG